MRPPRPPTRRPGSRPTSRARATAEERAAVDERRTRAIEEPLDVQLRSREVYPILEVRNPLHGTAYLVLLPEYPATDVALCGCTDFARRGLGTCKHIEAGVRWLRDHPEAPALLPARTDRVRPSLLWKEIDRREELLGRDGGPPSVAWRRPGRALFERPEKG